MASIAKGDDLTTIKWDHAVNSFNHLRTSLADNNTNMIEADVVIGTYESALRQLEIDVPIMAHPPANKSDLKLETFIHYVVQYNTNETNVIKKGIKLDFKTIEAFSGSASVLETLNYTLVQTWFNADILAGPVNNTETIPVDPVQFFNISQKFNESVLSIGWTTKWSKDDRDGAYTDVDTSKMLELIKTNKVQHKITFPVRAGIAANSLQQLKKLIQDVDEYQKSNTTTLTIWSSNDEDYIDIKKLKELIDGIGKNKTYLDVGKKVEDELQKGGARHITVNILSLAIAIVVGIFFKSF